MPCLSGHGIKKKIVPVHFLLTPERELIKEFLSKLRVVNSAGRVSAF